MVGEQPEPGGRLLDQCPPDLRGWEWHYLKRLRGKGLPPLRHDAAVLCAAISPDGESIASSDQDGVDPDLGCQDRPGTAPLPRP